MLAHEKKHVCLFMPKSDNWTKKSLLPSLLGAKIVLTQKNNQESQEIAEQYCKLNSGRTCIDAKNNAKIQNQLEFIAKIIWYLRLKEIFSELDEVDNLTIKGD
jgi:cysteine synthase